MAKMVVISDVHGYYSAFRYILDQLYPEDTLVVAGDFFDTKYGHHNSKDYNPIIILNEFRKLENRKYFVYGNCDEKSFSPGYNFYETFKFEGTDYVLTHGNFELENSLNYDIMISGHTHIRGIEARGERIFLNPGSIALPKDPSPSYAIIEDKKISLIGVDEGIVKTYDLEKKEFV